MKGDFDHMWSQEQITPVRLNYCVLRTLIEMLPWKTSRMIYLGSDLLAPLGDLSVFRNSHEITESENSEYGLAYRVLISLF